MDKYWYKILFFSSILVGSLYIFPQLLFFTEGNKGAYFVRDDGPNYAARIVRAMEGKMPIGDPWTYEGKDEPTLLPSLPDHIQTIFFRPFTKDANTVIILLRFILPLLGFLALVYFLRIMGMSRCFALVSSLWVFGDPAVYYYRPLLAFLVPNIELPFNRFYNPMFPLPIFFLACAAVYQCLRADTKRIWTVAAGILMGMQFYISIYYWTHLGLAILIYAFLNRRDQRWRELLLGIAISVAVAAPYLISLMSTSAHPVYPFIAWRNGLFLSEHAWYLLGHKTLWPLLIVSSLLYFLPRANSKFLLAAVWSGAICYFSSILTGISLQNFHWHYTLSPFVLISVFYVIQNLYQKYPKAKPRLSMILVLSALSLVLFQSFYFSRRYYEYRKKSNSVSFQFRESEYSGAWTWLKENASKDSVVLTSARGGHLIPIKTGLRTWMGSGVQFTSNAELLLRNQFRWWLQGKSSADLESEISIADGSVASWNLGMSVEMEQNLLDEALPTINSAIRLRIRSDIIKRQALFEVGQARELVAKKRLDFLLLGPNESNWGGPWAMFFEQEPVYSDDFVKIFKARE